MKNNRKKSKYSLDQIGDALFSFINSTNKRFDGLEARMDRLESRIDNIDTRLDYIVKANKLRDIASKK